MISVLVFAAAAASVWPSCRTQLEPLLGAMDTAYTYADREFTRGAPSASPRDAVAFSRALAFVRTHSADTSCQAFNPSILTRINLNRDRLLALVDTTLPPATVDAATDEVAQAAATARGNALFAFDASADMDAPRTQPNSDADAKPLPNDTCSKLYVSSTISEELQSQIRGCFALLTSILGRAVVDQRRTDTAYERQTVVLQKSLARAEIEQNLKSTDAVEAMLAKSLAQTDREQRRELLAEWHRDLVELRATARRVGADHISVAPLLSSAQTGGVRAGVLVLPDGILRHLGAEFPSRAAQNLAFAGSVSTASARAGPRPFDASAGMFVGSIAVLGGIVRDRTTDFIGTAAFAPGIGAPVFGVRISSHGTVGVLVGWALP